MTPPVSAIKGTWSATSTDGTYKVAIDGPDILYPMPPLYKQGNVLAVGVWNDGSGSSDLAVTAELSDNNGAIYVQDSSAAGGWPAGTIFRWKVVLYDDGTGEEEPGWQGRDFTNDTEANGWIQQTDVGFTVGHGGNDAENGETLLDSTNETVYTRSIFDAKNYETITQLTLKLAGDDEAVAWLNGTFLGYSASGLSDWGETAENTCSIPRSTRTMTARRTGPIRPPHGRQRQAHIHLVREPVEAPPVPVPTGPVLNDVHSGTGRQSLSCFSITDNESVAQRREVRIIGPDRTVPDRVTHEKIQIVDGRKENESQNIIHDEE